MYRVCLLLFVLGACASSPPAPVPRIDFGNSAILTFDVARIEIIDERTQAPQADLVTIQPFNVVKLWVTKRLRAGGDDGILRIIVSQAAIEEQVAPLSTLNLGFTPRAQFHYTGVIALTLQAQNQNAQAQGTLTVSQTTNMSEFSDRAQRRHGLQGLSVALANSLNHAMGGVISEHFQNFIISGG